MIITLNQGEIENALQKHINDLMNLKEGVSIGYEFKMTRGEEGITVILDINNGPVPAKPAQVAPQAAKAAPAPAAAKAETPAPVVKEDPKAPVAQANAESDPPFDTANQAGEAQTEASTTGATAETGTAQNASAEAGTAEAPKKLSLFAGLKQPK